MIQKKHTITIPESYSRQKLSALYKELPISDDVVKLLRKYLKAMANLYGILPLEHVYEIIIDQNPGLLTKADFVKYTAAARHEQEYFLLLGESDLYTNAKRHRTASLNGVLIDLLYVEMGDDYINRLAALQGNKPYYIPEKNILLRYHDCNYSEPTPYTRAMKRFWHETINYTEKSAELILADLVNLIRIVDFSMDDLQCFLEENHLDQITEEEMTEFLRLYTDLHNHTRMPCNRGYTPTEIHNLLPRGSYAGHSISFGENMQRQLRDGSLDLDELKTAIMSADISDEGLRQSMLEQLDGIKNEPLIPIRHTKVGRNEPCPCGSGKKYKKCCGR